MRESESRLGESSAVGFRDGFFPCCSLFFITIINTLVHSPGLQRTNALPASGALHLPTAPPRGATVFRSPPNSVRLACRFSTQQSPEMLLRLLLVCMVAGRASAHINVSAQGGGGAR